MTIYEDVGQKVGRHENIRVALERAGITVRRQKLNTGDYCLPPSVSVDTKKGLSEVYQDLVGDHDRFHREYARAAEDGIKLVFLIEDVDGDGIRRVEDVHLWDNPQSKHHSTRPSSSLQKQMETVRDRYGVEWMFCNPHDTGRLIIEILTHGNG